MGFKVSDYTMTENHRPLDLPPGHNLIRSNDQIQAVQGETRGNVDDVPA